MSQFSRRAMLSLAFGLIAPYAVSVQPGEQLSDPALEARARKLSGELRCLVCQNQSIDDSDAELARDLRTLVRERISAGDSDSTIRAFLVARYGEFVLLRPPFSLQTILLWSMPAIALICGGLMAMRLFRRKALPDDPVFEVNPPLGDSERDALDALIEKRKAK
ncbi:formate-dependent nitrite reductase complex subunit NrfF [Rhabdaerophilaceae bacterium]